MVGIVTEMTSHQIGMNSEVAYADCLMNWD